MRRDGHVRFDGKYYSVSEDYINKPVTVIGTSTQVALYHAGKLIETHARVTDRARAKSSNRYLPRRRKAFLLIGSNPYSRMKLMRGGSAQSPTELGERTFRRSLRLKLLIGILIPTLIVQQLKLSLPWSLSTCIRLRCSSASPGPARHTSRSPPVCGQFTKAIGSFTRVSKDSQPRLLMRDPKMRSIFSLKKSCPQNFGSSMTGALSL